MIANGISYDHYSSPDGHRCFNRHRFHTILAWLSSRVLRGGPRLIIQAAACFFGIYLLSRTLPQRASDVAFGRGYGTLWKWAGSRTGAPPVVDDGSVAGGLRLVVFGASDIATIPDDGESGETTWAEVMCTELDCSTYISLAPKSSRSLTSNSLYAGALQQVSREPDNNTAPGLDYSFYPEVYAVPWDLPDFGKQVSDFLSRPRPQLLPKETLWVFNFGHWDVWNLAALPIKVSQPIIDSMVGDIIGNIERLYQASRNESSIAHSDFLLALNGTNTATTTMSQRTTPGGDSSRTVTPADQEEMEETFRIVVPMIFDQTLAPGWKTGRPDIPSAHSKAEQMRNAATLTERWNNQLQNAVEGWVKAENPKPANATAEAAGDGEEVQTELRPVSKRTAAATSGQPLPTDAPTSGFRMISRRSAEEPKKEAEKPEPAYPIRDAIIYDLQEYVTEIIAERQLLNHQYVDQSGIGGKAETLGFRDVDTPCVRRAAAASAPAPAASTDVTKQHSSRDYSAGQMARSARGPASMRLGRRSRPADARLPLEDGAAKAEHYVEATKARQKDEAEAAAGAGGVCDMPRDHLFYTPLMLAPRAIHEMGREIADLVMRNVTLRAYWDGVV